MSEGYFKRLKNHSGLGTANALTILMLLAAGTNKTVDSIIEWLMLGGCGAAFIWVIVLLSNFEKGDGDRFLRWCVLKRWWITVVAYASCIIPVLVSVFYFHNSYYGTGWHWIICLIGGGIAWFVVFCIRDENVLTDEDKRKRKHNPHLANEALMSAVTKEICPLCGAAMQEMNETWKGNGVVARIRKYHCNNCEEGFFTPAQINYNKKIIENAKGK